MNILFVTTTLGTRGGIQRVTTVKANQFAELPDTKVAIAFSDRLGWPENAIHPLSPKVKVYDMDSPFWDREPKRFDIFWRFPQKALRLRTKLKAVIKDFNPDVVISTGQFEKFIIPFVATFRRKFITVREYHFASRYRQLEQFTRTGRITWKPKLINLFENKVLGRLFDSNFLLTKQDLRENFHHSRKMNFMWNPSSFEIAKNLLLPEKKHIILAVGRLTAQKNFKELLHIWALTQRQDWTLRILGEGEEKKDLINLSRELGIEDCTEIAGYTDNVQGEMLKASIFAGTSTFEGFMLVIVEAMSQGCVPVSFKTPYGPEDIITDGKDGFLVDMHDRKTFARKLSELVTNQPLREKMALNALSRAEDFDVKKICLQWLDHYHSLLDKKKY